MRSWISGSSLGPLVTTVKREITHSFCLMPVRNAHIFISRRSSSLIGMLRLGIGQVLSFIENAIQTETGHYLRNNFCYRFLARCQVPYVIRQQDIFVSESGTIWHIAYVLRKERDNKAFWMLYREFLKVLRVSVKKYGILTIRRLWDTFQANNDIYGLSTHSMRHYIPLRECSVRNKVNIATLAS
jgi:hypothetical protein